MQKYSTHKNTSGFTLIELLIVITIIGILAAIAIPQFNQYKIRGYDTHSKQALRDMHSLCNNFWLDTDSEQGCDLPIIKDATYGFNQNTDLVATLPPSPLDNFCASAKHNSSPNTYSIDSAALISPTGDCGKAEAVAIAEKAEAERQAVLETAIKKVVAENCCVERAANKNEGVGEHITQHSGRVHDAGCTNLNERTLEEQQICGDYQENSRKEALKGSFETGYPPDCYKVRVQWLTNYSQGGRHCGPSTTLACDEGMHASDFDLNFPDSPCARKF